MSLSYTTAGYFADFQCLGDRCEDTCCQQWEVRLDRRHYHRLQERMQSRPASRVLFEHHIRLNEREISGDHDYAFIDMADNGYCAMLDASGLCSIHKEFGVAPLGNVCAFYPRILSRCENEIELSGALSCPEVARRCLLDPEPPSYVPFSPDSLPRSNDYPLHRDLPRTATDHYARHFRRVRQAFLDLAAAPRSLETRLYALATLGRQLSEFYHQGCEAVPAAQLDGLLQHALSPTGLQEMAAFLQQYEAGEPVALIVIVSILQIKQGQFPQEATSQLAAAVQASYDAEYATRRGGAAKDIPIQELQVLFAARRARCQAACGSLVDDMLGRYVANCLYREWFYTMPDTFTYLQMLILRVAMLRFLIYSHPRLQELPADRARRRQLLEEVVVEVVYRFARNIDQNLPFLQVIYNAVSEQQMMSYDYSLAFIRC